MKMRIFGALTLVSAAISATLLAPTATAAPDYDPAMLTALATQLGTDQQHAADRLDREQFLDSTLSSLAVPTDGAFFDGTGTLVVNTPAAFADQVRRAGLTPRTTARGERALTALAKRVEKVIGADVEQVQAWGPDLVADTVVVTVEPDATAQLRAKLTALDGVTVVTGTERGAVLHADVVPGRIMDLVPGTNCSLGFPGTRNGAKVLLTAGHCVEGNPDVLDANGTHIGKGIATRFPSVDMGLMSIAAEDTGRGYVDTQMGTTVAVRGLSKAAVGSTICKAGNTTGWTCGKISSYNQTVRYSGESTATTGLARSTVCTEGGDSGGAYISGNSAQGMTSGGPSNGIDCGFNQGANVTGSYSYYQPVVDAANYYGVTLTTS